MKIKFWWVAGLLISLAACSSRKQQEVKLWGEAQGSTYSIVYIDKELRNFHEEVEVILSDIDESMSTWVPGSIISKVNRGESPHLDDYFLTVLQRSIEMFHETNGYFDITVAPLVNVWGFGSQEEYVELSPVQLDSLLNRVGTDKLTIENNRVVFATQGMQLDFNAIAQGYTVDVISNMLESKGITDYMVEVGGEVRTLGFNVNEKPWRIGIDKPVDHTDQRQLQAILKLSGQSLATSGSYRKFRMKDGIKFSHAIDPITGYPVQHSLLSVSVIADDCMTADAYATAFLVMGVEASMEFLKDKSIQAYFISDNGKGELIDQMTPGFKNFMMKDAFQ